MPYNHWTSFPKPFSILSIENHHIKYAQSSQPQSKYIQEYSQIAVSCACRIDPKWKRWDEIEYSAYASTDLIFVMQVPLGILRMSLKSGEDSTFFRTSKKWRAGVKLKGFWKPRESSSILRSIRMELNCSSRSLRTISEPRAWLRWSDRSFLRKSWYFANDGRCEESISVRFPDEKHWTAAKLTLNRRTAFTHIFNIFYRYLQNYFKVDNSSRVYWRHFKFYFLISASYQRCVICTWKYLKTF